MLPGPVVAAAHCKTHQKLEIFGNFVASRSAGPFFGRHFLLERHFAGEMISVGKVRRCPFKNAVRARPQHSVAAAIHSYCPFSRRLGAPQTINACPSGVFIPGEGCT